MATDPIPVVEVQGTHRQVGEEIGTRLAPSVQHLVSRLRDALPAGVAWQEMVDRSQLFLAHSRAVYPQYVDELEGIASAAGVPFEALWPAMCEELWAPDLWPRGCTDMAARGRATADGSTLLAHTNDLAPEAEKDLVILKVQAGEEPQFLGVTPGGVAYSAGFNAAGIGLTGNQVDANDMRVGVPRLLVVRAILGARRLEEALDACLLPQRASSYNNVVADDHGEVYSMEGSATGCAPIYIADDILAHANHYVAPSMRRFEADPADTAGSIIRHHRAWRLLRENYGRHSPELFQALLADHANYPGSICKHGLTTVTVFSIIVRLEERCGWIGRGRPCETSYEEHTLEPWVPPEGVWD
ncbi:MAG: C45 family autoproteolytic acyltransferase/hydrolase [Anaerolineae bacterium]